MLAKPGPLPSGHGWAFEPKWDSFRAIIRSGDQYCVRSRRGRLMTPTALILFDLPEVKVFRRRTSRTGSGARRAAGLSGRIRAGLAAQPSEKP